MLPQGLQHLHEQMSYGKLPDNVQAIEGVPEQALYKLIIYNNFRPQLNGRKISFIYDTLFIKMLKK
jgi:hypothetical protein